MCEITQTLTFFQRSYEYDTGDFGLYVDVRIWTDDGMTLEAEPLTYHYAGGRPIKLTNDAMSDFVRQTVKAELGPRQLEQIQDSEPMFEDMQSAPMMSRQEFMDMRI